MISQQDIERIRRLRKVGFTLRAISAQTGFARETVRSVVNGKHPLLAPKETHVDTVDHVYLFSEPPERCPGCGRMIHMPCLACVAEGYRRRKQREAISA